jgi:hypothetical protein
LGRIQGKSLIVEQLYDFTVPSLTTAQSGAISSFSNGTALKTTETAYVTDSNYIARQMVSLPSQTLVKAKRRAGSGARFLTLGTCAATIVAAAFLDRECAALR